MKLTEKNARFAVVKTAFHNGGTISFHTSLDSALKVQRRYSSGGCTCGCCSVCPITEDAQKEMVKTLEFCYHVPTLYADLPTWGAVPNLSPYQICK